MTAIGTLIGRGLASARPAAGTAGAVYKATDTRDLTRDNGATFDYLGGVKVQLLFATSTDLFTGVSAITQAAWGDIVGNQSFTVDDPNSLILVTVRGNFYMTGAAGGFGMRIQIDSAGTPVNKIYGGAQIPTLGASPTTGSGPVAVSGLAAGTHTVKVQCYPQNSGAEPVLRSATNPNFEVIIIEVLEVK